MKTTGCGAVLYCDVFCVFKNESSGKGNTDSETKLKGAFVAMC